MAEIKNISLEGLIKTHGNDAENIFQKVAEIGGFGAIEPNYKGGLDVSGLPESEQAKITKLIAAPDEAEKPDAKAGKSDNTATKTK